LLLSGGGSGTAAEFTGAAAGSDTVVPVGPEPVEPPAPEPLPLALLGVPGFWDFCLPLQL
jgi:hypothetical protein